MNRDCGPIVYKFLLSLCGNPDLAEELTAETFYQAYLHIDQFRGECKPETWLCQIAKHALYRETRRRRRLAPWRRQQAEPDLALWETLQDRQQAMAIYRLIHQLPEPYKEVFLLRALGELRFREIAAIAGKSESWAKVTFYRAKDKLLERMEEEHED